VGDDDFGHLILRRLQECGVDNRFVIVDPALATGLGIALCKENDRAILTFIGSLNAVYPEDITDDLLRSSHHIHHGSYFLHSNLRPAMTDIFRRALDLGLTTSLDTNWDPEENWNSGLTDLLPLTDVFFPNDQEALFISKTKSIENAIEFFNNLGVHITVIKQGERGSIAVSGKHHFTYKLPPVSGGDSIGAGDSFDAGFLAGWLRELPFEDCLKIASRCGREVAAQIGGLRGQPDWNSVKDLTGVDG
jgi:sugar/nucleoside kinase (ribokinase family)